METRANYVAVGIFTLVALVMGFVLVYWFGRFDGRDQLVPLDVRVQGSVSGLGEGSLVTFNGIDVGRVSGLLLDATDPRFVIVNTMVNKNTPVRADTRASIGIRGLSGGAYIQLEGGSPQELQLLQNPDRESSDAPMISGDPAALADLVQRVNELANTTERVMQTVEEFVKTNSATVTRTLTNAETFSKALSENSGGVDEFLSSAGKVAESLTSLSNKLDGSVTRFEEILQAINPETVGATVNSVKNSAEQIEKLTTDANAVLANVNRVVASVDAASIKTTVDNINAAAARISALTERIDTSAEAVIAALQPDKIRSVVDNAEKLTRDAQGVVASIDGTKLSQTIDDISQTASNARNLLEGVDQNAIRTLVNEMGNASKNVTTILQALDAAKINDAVDNISSAASGAQKVVEDVSAVTERFSDKGDDIDKIFAETTDLSTRLNAASARVDGILDKVDDLIGSDQTEGLVADARATLATFRQTARSLSRQIGSISGDINSFTKRGLGDTQGLIKDARQSLNSINRVIRNLENNPSSLITGSGGSRIRETSSGRPRR